MAIALVRPGYADSSGATSSVRLLRSGRNDRYTKENVAEVGAAIERLSIKYKPRRLIGVGHFGAAATTALLLGMKPELMQAAVLVSCPCELVARRTGRRAWSRSENPINRTAPVSPAAKVIALTGTRDDNTLPERAQACIGALQARGIDATYPAVPEATHNSAFRAPQVPDAIGRLLGP
jgi:pimeloyl-ACP methyl ester carboxylesterase